MANMLTRQQVIDALRAAGVEFDDEATMTQLRPLYDQMIANIQQEGSNSSDIR